MPSKREVTGDSTTGPEPDDGADEVEQPESGESSELAAASDARDGAVAAQKSGGEKAGSRKRLLRPVVVIPVLLVAVLACSTAYLGFRLYSVNSVMDARAAATASGKQYALGLTTYDFRELEDNFAVVRNNSTDEFGRQYKKVSDSLTELIKQHQATSKGKVVQTGVSEATWDRVVLTMFVDQTITNTNTPEPRVDRNRMRMTVVRSEDRWLVQDLQLL